MFKQVEEKLKKVAISAATPSSNVQQQQSPPTFGVLIVGLGGNNGVTMLAGQRANQLVGGYKIKARVIRRSFYIHT